MDADAEGPPPGFGARAFSVAVDPAAVSVPVATRARAFAAADAAAAARDERAAVGSAAERARACPLRRTEAFFSAENADDKSADKNESVRRRLSKRTSPRRARGGSAVSRRRFRFPRAFGERGEFGELRGLRGLRRERGHVFRGGHARTRKPEEVGRKEG
jgi:hypothetical protein